MILVVAARRERRGDVGIERQQVRQAHLRAGCYARSTTG
jgi:hypothetical protein